MAQEVLKGNFADELKSRYLTYALSTIMSRALPDVRDGLKPVHRRILYTMRLLRLDPEKGHKKSARVVGDVMGKYHPHGDQAIYDAMVRLAQDFSVRYPLVDGQGNFGSIDGDRAAAMRYTEARLTEVAEWIMKDLDEGTVDFRPTYDESDTEPVVMPSCFPNLLANGSSGIAVGLSTSIPPHNVGELCGALAALLKKPDMTDAAIMKHVKGPDFPTGGIITENAETIQAAYASGRGSFRVRARWEKEDIGRGQYQIVITDIPYQVQKSRLIEKIADLIYAKKVNWLADVRDESDEKIRLVLEPKNRNVDANALMEILFQKSDLESRISLNMNVITAKGTPSCMSLKEALQAFLDHRRVVLVRRSQWRVDKIAERLHILEAYQVVFLNIDEVIEIIKTHDEPAPIMMKKFSIDEIQAEAILNMRLRRLRKLAEMEIKQEYDALKKEQKGLMGILKSENKQTETLLAEVKDIKKKFADKRRTDIEEAVPVVVVPLEAHVEKEPVTVLISEQGWARVMKGHMAKDAEAKYKEGDGEAFRIHGQSIENIHILGSSGRVYMLPISKLPSGRGFGEPLNMMFEFQPNERVVFVFIPRVASYLVATRNGLGFVVEAKNLKALVKTGKQVLNVAKGDEAAFCVPVIGNAVATIADNRNLLVYGLDEVPTMGRGKGVKLMNVKKGTLEDVCVFESKAGFKMLSGTGTRKRSFLDTTLWQGKRAQVGKALPHGFHKEARFFIPDLTVAEDEPEEESERIAELVSAITAPLPEDVGTPGLFDSEDDD